MISCRCLNFIGTSPQLQRSSSTTTTNNNTGGGGNNIINNNSSNAVAGDPASVEMLRQAFVQKFPRSFFCYDDFMDFFKHAYGPIPDLTVNIIAQKPLLYSATLDVSGQRWQLCICLNCYSVLYARRLTAGAGAGVSMTIYYLNSNLLCSNDELSRRRNHKSYSETFGLIIMERNDSNQGASAIIPPRTGVVNSVSSLSIGSLSSHAPLDGKQQRLRQLQAHQQQRVQSEIAETNQTIERFTEQKFELLKIFREKSNQEAACLMDLIQQIPEAANELLDSAMPVALEVTGGAINYAGAGPTARRRNTISSRRELSIPTTPTTPLVQPPSFLSSVQQEAQQPPQFSSLLSMMQQPQHELPSSTILTTRKMSNFDTPPATPESTPMSVGSSPTFRQQQQAVTAGRAGVSNTSPTAASASAEDADDCLFALDDMDGPGSQSVETMQNVRIYQQQQHQHYQRQLQQQPQELLPQQQQQDNMSDADEAEDALNSSFSIPMRIAAEKPFSNFARSMPVQIANSPLAERVNHNKMNSSNNNNNVVEDVEVLDNTVDIAASIKALAKSVHGEAVFGDLPRPRLRSEF